MGFDSIIALDLGKFKSVAAVMDVTSRRHSFVTLSTLLAALGGAPFFVVAFGLIVVGLVLAGTGWARWRLYRGRALPFDRGPSR